MAVSSHSVSLLKKEQITEDAYKFHFKKPRSFQFIAGQYLKMKLSFKNPDSRGNSRYFTISSSPTEKDLQIITKIGKSSFKQALSKLKPGEKVQIRGPWGDFVLDEKEKRSAVFLAGGIGLTPFRSILKYNLDTKKSYHISMINSYSDKAAAELSSVLDEFKKLPKFSLEVVFKRIITDFLQKQLDSSKKYVYYISGPEKMVSSLAADLIRQGVEEKNIKLDDFPGYTVRD